MITFNRVTKYFPTPKGRHYILKDVSLTLPGDKNIGVFGANGSGKSTLMNLLAGVDQPNRGSIRIKGNVSWPLGLSGYQNKYKGHP